MFGDRPKTAQEQRRAERMAARMAELRQERALLRGQVIVERDVALRMHMHELIAALDEGIEMLRIEEASA